jgi:hypothetical protein
MRDERMLDLADRMRFGAITALSEGPSYPALTGPKEASASLAKLTKALAAAAKSSDPDGIRTHVPSVRGWCPNR